MESGNDYVIQVKGNYRKVLNFIKRHIENNDYIDIDYTLEKNKGRTERRVCKVYQINKPLEEYESCRTIIHITNSGIRGGKQYSKEHYYISNKITKEAAYFSKGIRGHWSIENRCHWVKDVILYEDRSLVKGMELSGNLSVLRNIIINLYRLNNHQSIKKAIEKYSNRIKESIELINKSYI